MKKLFLIFSAAAVLFAGCKKVDEEVAVTGVTLSPTYMSMAVGTEKSLTAAVEPSNASNIKVAWTTDNDQIATVDNAGKVTARAKGETWITVITEDGGLKARCRVTVSNKNVPVITAPAALQIGKGEEIYINPTVTPTTLAVEYISNRPDFAIVDNAGKVTGVEYGVAEILITTKATEEYEAASATCVVTVKSVAPKFSALDNQKTDETVAGRNDGTVKLIAKLENDTPYEISACGFVFGGETITLPSARTELSYSKNGLVPKNYTWSAFVTLSNGKTYKSEEKSFAIREGHGEGYESIDLGLPSGTRWATCNVGADSPEAHGTYFAWGEIVGYMTASAKTGGFNANSYGYKDSPKILPYNRDAATANCGVDWSMPTQEDYAELADTAYCVWEWQESYNGSGVNGWLVTSRVNGEFLFFPVTGVCMDNKVEQATRGYYWTGESYKSDANKAWILSLTDKTPAPDAVLERCYGAAVRAVKK